jgi:small-conductance mechanosensitive channel
MTNDLHLRTVRCGGPAPALTDSMTASSITRLRWEVLLSLLLVVAPAGAAQVPDSGNQAPSGATVMVGNDTLFALFGRLGPFGPQERANALTRKIALLGSSLARGADSIRVEDLEGVPTLLVGDQILMMVLAADAAPTGKDPLTLATEWAGRIQRAVEAERSATSLRALAFGALRALLATLLLVGLLYLFRYLFGRLYGLARSPRVPSLHIKRFELLSAARFADALTLVVRVTRIVLTIMLLYLFVPLVLSFFPWTAPLSRRIVGYVLSPLHAVWLGFTDYLPNIFFILVIVLVTRYLLSLIRLVFQALKTGALTLEGFHADWADPTYNIVRFLVLAFAAVVMFPYLPGAESDAFKGVSLFVGVLFSLGSSGAVGNIVAGVVLTYTRAFQIGDRVRIGETTGDVVERTLLVTRVRTIKNEDITIPNGSVLSSQVINYTSQAASRGLILNTTVTIGYDAPWRQVHELLIGAARACEGILEEPAPFVLQTSLDDFYVSYQLNAYTDKPAIMARTYSELHQQIQDKFNAAGVEIMSPHYRAARDGNQTTIPSDNLPKDYRAPAFRVVSLPPAGPDR